MKIKLLKSNQSGVTLMEVLVVTALFATISLIITDIFMSASRSQRVISESGQLHADARFAMEAISREVRMGEIDYDYYRPEPKDKTNPEISLPENELAIIDQDGNRLLFKKGDEELGECEAGSGTCLAVSVDNGLNFYPITPKNFKVTDLQFFISPDNDPFRVASSGYLANEQPRVTIVLASENITDKPGEKVEVNIQTTVSSRTYKR